MIPTTEQQQFYRARLDKDQHLVAELIKLKTSWIDTALGAMLAISDEKALYLLEFLDKRGLEHEIEKLRLKLKAAIVPGKTKAITLVEKELHAYFQGTLKVFKTPFHSIGSDFQKNVWQQLLQIPYGKTQTYSAQADALKKPRAYRAVANANGANPLAIIVPCHRIIKSNGDLGGYSGGIQRKSWLIEHESKHAI